MRGRQLELGLPSNERRSARKPRQTTSGKKRNVPHRARPWHDARHPVHVTLRAESRVPYLREEAILEALVRTFRRASREGDFRVVHFSVQADHVHLVVEASSREALARRMNGLTTWAARRINRVARRSGKVWNGRYHRRDLASPTEVRNVLLYVLQNRRKHVLIAQGRDPGGFDLCSSAAWLEGWEAGVETRLARIRALHAELFGPDPPVARPRRWLTDVGWRRGRGGLLRVREVPSVSGA